MAGQVVFYRRVSTAEQNLERQGFDCDIQFDRVFEDKLSGKDRNRPQLKECLSYLRQQDQLVCASIDRLARNLKDLLDIITELNGRGVSVRFLKERLVFTGEHNPIQDLQLQILGAVASYEREMINARVREGVAVKKAKDPNFWKQHCGRKRVLCLHQIATIRERLDAGERVTDLAKEYGVSRTCLYSYLKDDGRCKETDTRH